MFLKVSSNFLQADDVIKQSKEVSVINPDCLALKNSVLGHGYRIEIWAAAEVSV